VFLLHTVNKIPPHQYYQQLANIWSGHSHYLVPVVAKQGVKTVKMSWNLLYTLSSGNHTPGRANSTLQNDDSCLAVFPPHGYFTKDPKSIEIICTKMSTYMATSMQVTRYLYALHILNLLSN